MGKLSVFEEALGGLVKKFKGKKAIEHGGAPVSPERDKMRIANEHVKKMRRWNSDLEYIARQLGEDKKKFRFDRHPATLKRRYNELVKAIKASHESNSISDHQKRRMLQRAAAMKKLLAE